MVRGVLKHPRTFRGLEWARSGSRGFAGFQVNFVEVSGSFKTFLCVEQGFRGSVTGFELRFKSNNGL